MPAPHRRPWARIEFPDGGCLPLEGPCPECLNAGPCEMCHGTGRVLTKNGRSLVDLVAAYPVLA